MTSRPPFPLNLPRIVLGNNTYFKPVVGNYSFSGGPDDLKVYFRGPEKNLKIS